MKKSDEVRRERENVCDSMKERVSPALRIPHNIVNHLLIQIREHTRQRPL